MFKRQASVLGSGWITRKREARAFSEASPLLRLYNRLTGSYYLSDTRKELLSNSEARWVSFFRCPASPGRMTQQPRKRVQGVGKPAALVRTKVVEPSFVVETNSLGFRNRMLLAVATPIGAGAGAGVQLPPTQICFGE